MASAAIGGVNHQESRGAESNNRSTYSRLPSACARRMVRDRSTCSIAEGHSAHEALSSDASFAAEKAAERRAGAIGKERNGTKGAEPLRTSRLGYTTRTGSSCGRERVSSTTICLNMI